MADIGCKLTCLGAAVKLSRARQGWSPLRPRSEARDILSKAKQRLAALLSKEIMGTHSGFSTSSSPNVPFGISTAPQANSNATARAQQTRGYFYCRTFVRWLI